MSFTASLEEVVRENYNGLLSSAPHWTRTRLGSLARITNGVPLPSSKFNESRGVPVVRIRNVLRGETETLFDGPHEEHWFINPGDLLIGMDGDFHCAIWRGPRALLNQRVCKVEPTDSRVSVKYLAYVLPGYLAAVHRHTSSITVKHLSSRTIADIPVPVPARAEQDLLVAELDGFVSREESVRRSLKRARESVKRARASVLKAAVEGRLVPTEAELARAEGRESPNGQVLLAQIHSDRAGRSGPARRRTRLTAPMQSVVELESLPEGWVPAAISDLSWEAGYGTSQRCDHSADGPPVLRIPNVQSGAIDLNDLKFATDGSQLKPDGVLEPGDFVFVRTNGSLDLIGRGALVKRTHSFRAWFASYLIRFRLCGPELAWRWFATVWASPQFRQLLERDAASSAGQHNISLSSVMRYSFPLPPEPEMLRIVTEVDRRMSVLDAVEASIDANLARVEKLRQSILKRAFEGKLTAPASPATADSTRPDSKDAA